MSNASNDVEHAEQKSQINFSRVKTTTDDLAVQAEQELLTEDQEERAAADLLKRSEEASRESG